MLPECCNLRPGTPGWERGLTAACKAYVGLGPPGSTARRFLPPITSAQSKPPHPPMLPQLEISWSSPVLSSQGMRTLGLSRCHL